MSELAHGLLLQDQGRLEEAEACYYGVLAREPDNDFVYGRLALCQMSQTGKKRQALATISEAIRLRPDEPFYHSVRALILTDLHRGKEALEAATRAVALNPEDSLAHVNAGWSALQTKDQRRAEMHFREALRLDPESAMARDGLIESFRARSRFYRLYLSYCFFMQRFTGGKQWMIILGMYVCYQIARNVTKAYSPVVGGVLVAVWLGLVLWVWLAPGIGNFLILLDRSARLALKNSERLQGIAVGGGLFGGGMLGLAGYLADYYPLMLGGFGMIVSAVPASLAFDNESARGRILFGIITAYVYLTALVAMVVEGWRHPATSIHGLTSVMGALALLAAIACTWLGNIRSLRRSSEG